ncbi:MAG: insulinase family protein [Chitinophagales bacterium]|nr:insulinase family protein [Chitinophagales bacterium]MCZ2393102.1 insulinase family protein [Chitinophagales bacterium]
MMAQSIPQPTLIEELKQTDNSVLIPYKKFKYPNGLTVILHEDHSDPIVYVDVTYHVGSARETPGRSGFAHFFEHMMFQGSDNVGDEKHFSIVTEAGGTLNGTTNRDRTNYFETMPSNYLETALWLEADRMGYLLDAVTTKKFEIQRATVKNERQQNYDNRPYGLVFEKIGEALYPFGHPYSWTTIGYLEDIDKFTLPELKNFFLRWYGPNNATLTIAGKFDEQEVLQLVGKYFGNIPQGPAVDNMPKIPVALDSDRYISYEDNIKFPFVSLTFPSAPANTKDEIALDALAYLLGGNNNKKSPFYQRFIKTQKAMQASVSNPSSELAGQFSMSVVAYPQFRLKDIENEIRTIIDEFDISKINEADFNEYIASEYSNLLYSLQSVQRKGTLLAYSETFTGNPAYTQTAIEITKNLKLEDVKQVFEKYIKGKHSVVLSVYFKDDTTNIAAKDNFHRPSAPDGFQSDLSEYNNLTYVKGKDNFDRSIQPQPSDNPIVEIPQFWNKIYKNGTKVIGTSYEELPITSISIVFKAGHFIEPVQKAGISDILASLLKEGTKQYTSEQFQSELKKIGSILEVYSDNTDFVVNITSLNENLDRTIELVKQMLLTPRFDSSEFERIRMQQLQAIKFAKTNAGSIADIIEAQISYPENHILSLPESGNEKTVQNITLEDVKNFYFQYVAPDFAELYVVGNIDKKLIDKQFSFIKKMKRKGIHLPEFVSVNAPEQTTIVFVHKDKSPQSQIKVVGKGLKYDGLGDYYKAGIANYPLGGMFNSRININLRERKGWTYGARSYFLGTDFVDKFIVSTGVKAANTDSSVIEIMSELNGFVNNGITEDELSYVKKSIGQRDALKYETAAQKAVFLERLVKNGFDSKLVDKQLSILNQLSQEDINQIVKEYIHPKHLFIIVVGDRSIVYDSLKSLNYPIIEKTIE